MPKAILTKYIGTTNTKGSRIKAYDLDGNSIYISYDYELNDYDLHKKAAEALRDKMGWHGQMVGGGIKEGFAFVFIS